MGRDMIVAIIGPDGCGKTTQAKKLSERLKRKGYNTIYVQPVYILLNILKCSKNITSISPRKIRTSHTKMHKSVFHSMKRILLCLLGYVYAFITYLFMKISLGRNKIVISDRYFYQFFFDLFGNWSQNIVKIFPKPDITFFLDGDLTLFYSRMNDPFDTSVSSDYYRAVLNFYRKISQENNFIRIDANLDKETINDIMFKHLTKKVKGDAHG